ncbi:unnamed protein product [Microthlaspi erraticum]|uniref:Uncharacterized protein n=1 Tax=Microthlaspi erraticum TaxID=1685480 RepID=A0A6D2KZY8_9BRAS|nr:unnamed protein product [Microthlaspi erraticum]
MNAYENSMIYKMRTKAAHDKLIRLKDFKVFWSILEHMGREEHGMTWCMDAAQLDTERKKEVAILKPSSTGQASTRSSWEVKVKPEKCCFPLDLSLTLNINPLVF